MDHSAQYVSLPQGSFLFPQFSSPVSFTSAVKLPSLFINNSEKKLPFFYVINNFQPATVSPLVPSKNSGVPGTSETSRYRPILPKSEEKSVSTSVSGVLSAASKNVEKETCEKFSETPSKKKKQRIEPQNDPVACSEIVNPVFLKSGMSCDGYNFNWKDKEKTR